MGKKRFKYKYSTMADEETKKKEKPMTFARKIGAPESLIF
jgi:hypothetical protein